MRRPGSSCGSHAKRSRKSARPQAGERKKREDRKRRANATAARRPLLVIDGDSFAHRAYHALPETILRRERTNRRARSSALPICCCGSIRPNARGRCLSPGIRSERRPTGTKFPAYQSGRQFDDAVVEQLDVLPEFVKACGFKTAKRAGYEADDFLAAAVAAEEKRYGAAAGRKWRSR